MSPIQSEMWILGDVFIRNYYVAIKYDEGVIDLYPKETQSATLASNSVSESSSFPLAKLVIGIFVALAVSVIGVMAWWTCMGCRKRDKLGEQDELLLTTWTH